MKKNMILVSLLTAVLLFTFPALTMAEGSFGSGAVVPGETYTLEQMLTYAMQDEYMAQAEYNGIIDAYGSASPLSNILKAEGTHVNLLKALFETYDITLPENNAGSKVTIPASLQEAYQLGIDAENANIVMYQAFLAQSDLPKDVSDTFTSLMKASENHLAAYTRNVEKTGLGQGSQNGKGNGGAQMNTQCSGDCTMENSRNKGNGENRGHGRNGRN